MEMTKIKIATANKQALNWLVAKQEGLLEKPLVGLAAVKLQGRRLIQGYFDEDFDPCEDWSQGGPIAERERIFPLDAKGLGHDYEFSASKIVEFNYRFDAAAPLPLMAVMRCYLLSTVGPEALVPKELAL